MKPILFLTAAVLLFCGGNGMAQVADDPPQTRPMTRYEKAIVKIDNMNDLKTAYDTLKTDYDRRYFLHALPGYFTDHKVKTTPEWVRTAVLDGIESKDPLLVNQAINTAAVLKLECAQHLMDRFSIVRDSFGSNFVMLETSIIRAVSRMSNPYKAQFYTGILEKESLPILSSSFNALIDAMVINRSQLYSEKLADYSGRIGSIITELEAKQGEKYYLEKYKELKGKIDTLCDLIAQDATRGGEK
ncbi:MAG: hypothetical protein JXA71_19840 [Chitinispirillaceae bacterium]|nr:hypothetical protein [Chitinispirillaceae bacterium]